MRVRGLGLWFVLRFRTCDMAIKKVVTVLLKSMSSKDGGSVSHSAQDAMIFLLVDRFLF